MQRAGAYERAERAGVEAGIPEKSSGRIGWGVLIGFGFGLLIGFLFGNVAAALGFGTGFGLLAGVFSDVGEDRTEESTDRLGTTGRV